MPHRNSGTPRKRAQGTRRPSRGPWRSLPFWAVVAVAAIGVGMVLTGGPGGEGPAHPASAADRDRPVVRAAAERALAGVLPGFVPGPASRATDRDLVPAGAARGGEVRCRLVPVAPDRDWTSVAAACDSALAGTGAAILWTETVRTAGAPDRTGGPLRMDVGPRGAPTHTLVLYHGDTAPPVAWSGTAPAARWDALAADRAPTIALIIDDWGYGRNERTDTILDLDIPLTMSVLPGLTYTEHFAGLGTELILPEGADRDPAAAAAAQRRRAAGCLVEVFSGAGRPVDGRRREIMLHWPMQPEPPWTLGREAWAVTVGMSREEADRCLTGALAAVPEAHGANNHMGSAATADRATMDAVMSVLRERGMFFIDSLTTPKSVAWEAARDAGVPCLRNQGFLDPEPRTQEEVRTQLAKLVRRARKRGFALAIGHPLPETAAVLAQEIPRLRAEGIRFVTVSEMMALRRVAAEPAS